MNEKKTYTAEEFKAICRDMIPVLDELRQLAAKNGLDLIHISVSGDGYLDMIASGFCGWELTHSGEDGEYMARYSYSERFELGEEAKA